MSNYSCPFCHACRPLLVVGLALRCAACGALAGHIDDDDDAPPPLTDVLQVQRLAGRATMPRYANALDAGMDLYALDDVTIRAADGRVKVPLGIAVSVPVGHEGQIRPRSGLTLRGLTVHLGTIDAGYRGELACIIEADRLVRVPYGQAIAQLVVAPVTRCAVVEALELEERDGRGEGGFGSTDLR